MTTKDLLRALPKPQEDNYLMTKKHRDLKAKKKEEDFYKKYPECRIKISFSNNVSGNDPNSKLVSWHKDQAFRKMYNTNYLYQDYSES